MKHLIFILCVFILTLSVFTTAACCHDNKIMRANNDRMRQTLAEMIKQQEQQNAEIRIIKTDAATALRIVTTGEYMEAKK